MFSITLLILLILGSILVFRVKSYLEMVIGLLVIIFSILLVQSSEKLFKDAGVRGYLQNECHVDTLVIGVDTTYNITWKRD